MNSVQITSGIDRLLTVMATWFLGYAVQKKWLSEADSAVFLPAIVALPAVLWGVYKNRTSAVVAATDSLPGVAGVVTKNTEEGRELANAVPSETVAPAGSMSAKEVAINGAKS